MASRQQFPLELQHDRLPIAGLCFAVFYALSTERNGLTRASQRGNGRGVLRLPHPAGLQRLPDPEA